MFHQSLYKMSKCPSCQTPKDQTDWLTWCSRCSMIVCSKCEAKTHECKDGFHFGIPGRGTRYFGSITTHED